MYQTIVLHIRLTEASAGGSLGRCVEEKFRVVSRKNWPIAWNAISIKRLNGRLSKMPAAADAHRCICGLSRKIYIPNNTQSLKVLRQGSATEALFYFVVA